MADNTGMTKANRAKIMARHDGNKVELDDFMRNTDLRVLVEVVKKASAMTHNDEPIIRMVGHLSHYAMCELLEKHYDIEGNKKDV